MRRIWRTLHLIGAAALVALTSRPLASQVVRGVVVSDGMSAGIPGAVVLLLDSAGVVRARGLTAERGEFRIASAPGGPYRLRTLRIGFRPSTTERFVLTRDTSVILRVLDLPVELPAMSSTERAQCRARPDSNLALAALWEDVKTALVAAAITREAARYRIAMVDHARLYGYGLRELKDISVVESRVQSGRSWVTAPAEDFRAHGYVVDKDGTRSFFAPDIETLLSSYFADTHCFRIARASGADSMVGIGFEPVRGIKHVEIGGVLSIDRRTHELRRLDFHYTNLRLANDDTSAGGHVEFVRLSTGGWVVSDWAIRIPVYEVVMSREVAAARPGPLRPNPMPVPTPTPLRSLSQRLREPTTYLMRTSQAHELRVIGGTLRSVSLDTTIIWKRPDRTIDVDVVGGPGSRMYEVDSVTAYLVGARRFAEVDSAGHAVIEHVVPGSYLLEVGTRELDILGWPRARVRVDVGSTPRSTATIRLDPALAAARSMCQNAKDVSESSGVLIGRVVRDSQPVFGREVTVSWKADAGNTVARTVRSLVGDGRFFTCGVPRERPIEVRVAGQSQPLTTRISRDQVVGIVSIAVNP